MGKAKAKIKYSYCLIAICVLLSGFFSACGSSGGEELTSDNVPTASQDKKKTQTTKTTRKKTGNYKAPEMKMSPLDNGAAEKLPEGLVDLSHLGEGYVAVSIKESSRMKFQIIKEDSTYNYDVPADGSPAVYPLNMDSGTYKFRLMKNVSGNKYTQSWAADREVNLQDEFQPYLRPNQFVNYTASSDCVKKAAELAAKCNTDLDLAEKVYKYVVSNIVYDDYEAETVQTGYIPDPDEVLSTKKGICFDYASLAAAMLRSQGVPTQLITGYMGADSLYHAWNRIYIKGKGWIVGEIKVTGQNWKRVDMTLAASGKKADFLEDDGNYTTRYTY